MVAKNALLYGQRKTLKVVQSAWSDDHFEEIPFRCDPKLSDEELSSRISAAIYKKHPPRHYAGCGYSCSVREVRRNRPDGGVVEIMHYQGIGD